MKREEQRDKRIPSEQVRGIFLVAEMITLFILIFAQIRFGLFAIRRSDTTNYAMFDPDFCGVLFCHEA